MRKILLLAVLTIGLFCSWQVALAQKTITGKVTDDKDGTTMPGVTVLVKGTTIGTITDGQGVYKIDAPANATTLVFSFVGFNAKEVATGTQSIINVKLKGGDSQLGEVVVTAMGISKKDKALGYAAPTVTSNEIIKTSPTNFAMALYGKAPGLRISASPGGSTSGVNMVIRGINSITGKTQPLIVMDGVPIRDGEYNNGNYWGDQRLRGTGMLDINPEDVESISVLKGASAAALYGSEAVNGVILVTSKNGKGGKKGFTVDANLSSTVDNVAFLTPYQNVRGAGAQPNVISNTQSADGFYHSIINGTDTRQILDRSINFGPKFDGQPVMAWDGVMRPYSAQPNGVSNLFQTALSTSINVSMSNSSENSNTRFSFTRQDNEGTSIGSKNAKNNFNLNSTYRFSKKLSMDLTLNYVNSHITNRPYSTDRLVNNFSGMMGTFDNGNWYLNKYQTSQGWRYQTGGGQSMTPNENIKYNGFKGELMDFIWRVKTNNEDEYNDRLIGNITTNYEIIKNLKLRTRFATDVTARKIEDRNRSEQPVSFYNSGSFGLSNYKDNIFYGDALLTYTKKLIPDLEMSLMGGYTAKKDNYINTSVSTKDGLSVENRFDISSSIDRPWSGGSIGSFVSDAFIGTANFNYKDYLYLEGNVRRDRYSTMNPNSNSFVYPSLNSSFILSEALHLPSFVNFAKLRASWGIVGNYPGQYEANVAYNQSSLGVMAAGGSPIIYTQLPGNMGNESIRPEKKHEIEFGLQTRMLNNRLSLDVSYYNAQLRDQILGLTLPITTGGGSVLTNVGTMRNTGLEIGINGTPVQLANFKWETGVNWAVNKNKIEQLANNATELIHANYDGDAAVLKSTVGQPMGDLYAHPVLLNASGQKVVGADGLYSLDADHMKKIGNAMPKAVGGIFNTFTYKSFSLDAMIDFRLGGYVMPTGVNWMTSRGLTKESLGAMDKEHGGLSYYNAGNDGSTPGIATSGSTGPNGEKVYNDGMLLDGVDNSGNKNTNIVSQAYYYWNVYNWGGPQYSESRYELYIKKNSFFKMREIAIGYDLPRNLVHKIGANKLRVSVYGRNLFYIYRTLKNVDAEATTAGSRWQNTINNAGQNPATQSYGIMLRASF